MKKTIMSLTLTFLLLLSLLPAPAARAADTVRYTVLVLDTSATSDFENDGAVFYTAGTAIDYVKTAAKKFVDNTQEADGTNYLAIVSYCGDTASVVSQFSTDAAGLKQSIDNLYSSQTTRSVSSGLQSAYDLLQSAGDDATVLNVVLFTTGMTNAGPYSYDGPYDESTVGSIWRRNDTQVRLYAYSNSALAVADEIKEIGNLYTIGLFQTMDDMPEQGRDVVELFKLFAQDCASSPNHFYDVKDPEELEFIFGKVAEDLKDSDGDGLADIWESEGVTLDGTFIDLPAMGANPSVPDVFVEVDWMVEPKSSFLWFETKPETSLAPSENAMKLVYRAFKKHGIRLHIDVGPNSKDFVTGKKWGANSGGNEIPYEENFAVTTDRYAHWNDVVNANFSSARQNIFKHCLFVNQYDGGTSSGIANDIPGQYFIVANQSWVRKTGDTGIAGTFMHEMGHTLGLCHGGHTVNGEGNHTHYKPNYLSIMNYLFQTSGLVGTNEVNYSEYKLPDLDESNLDESAGIDPAGLTAGTGLGTKFWRSGVFGPSEHTVVPISKASVDYSGWWGVEDGKTVSIDLNKDDVKEVLTSSNDWDHIVFKGGDLGKEYAYIAGLGELPEIYEEALQEPGLDVILESGALGNEGAGAVESVGPVTILANVPGQNLHLRVSNLTDTEQNYQLTVKENAIVKAFSKTVTVPGSGTEIAYVDVAVPLTNSPAVGTYQIVASLNDDGTGKRDTTFEIQVYQPTSAEKDKLIKAIEDNALDELLPEDVVEECREALKHVSIKNPFKDVKKGAYYYDPVLWAVNHDPQITNGTSETTFSPNNTCTRGQVVTFLWRAAGEPKPTTKKNPFKDVKSDAYYYNAVLWAVENGITNGTSKTTFSPGSPCTRAHVVTFLWRAEDSPKPGGKNPFKDVAKGQYYTDAVLWAVSKEITNGTSAKTFSPSDPCTRGQIVTFLYRDMK